MSARAWLSAGALALVLNAALQGGAQDPPAPVQTFRTSTDVVLVDVSVRDGGQPVTGLRAEDFVLIDNGVRQQVESVEATAVPIDLTLVVDLSGNPGGAWVAQTPASKATSEVQAEIDAVTAMLRPGDRVRVLAIDRHVQLLAPMSPVESLAPLRPVEFDGLPSLFDTLATALLHPVEPARRHVVVARTKGRDSLSSVDAQTVQSIAERADARLHLVLMETAFDMDEAVRGFQCTFMGMCWPARRFWVPARSTLMGGRPRHVLTRVGETIASAADATGGALHKTMLLNEPTLTSTFKKVFEDFRSSYVLRYTLQGVPAGGWHTIDVKVPRSRSYTVRARRGYGVEDPVPSPNTPAAPEVPKTLTELTAAYERGAHRQLAVGLRRAADPARLLSAFEDGGNPWPATPSREAAFALELAEPMAFSSKPAEREQALRLLERFSRLVRHPLEPDTFERYWYFAALTMLEGSVRPATTSAFVERALGRFPDEPRFVLSRAITSDLHLMVRAQQKPTDGDAKNPAPVDHQTVRRDYEAAIAHPEIAVEARIRFAYYLHRGGQHGAALVQLNEAGREPITDPYLRYLRHLFMGHVLSNLDRREAAGDAYRAALDVVPGAQSARVALMNVLLLGGDRATAEALAEQVQDERAEGIDPWWMYWQGQYRLQPLAIGRIRELSR